MPFAFQAAQFVQAISLRSVRSSRFRSSLSGLLRFLSFCPPAFLRESSWVARARRRAPAGPPKAELSRSARLLASRFISGDDEDEDDDEDDDYLLSGLRSSVLALSIRALPSTLARQWAFSTSDHPSSAL
jgi:hypothetical protein